MGNARVIEGWRCSPRGVVTCLALGAALAVVGCGASPHRSPVSGHREGGVPAGAKTTGPSATSASTGPFRFFSPASFWNTPVSSDAAVSATTAEVASSLASTVATEESLGDGPWINTTRYSVPIYTVPADQPLVRVRLRSASDAALAAAWSAVPLPPTAVPAPGTNGHLVVWQPSTDRMWEFWRLAHEGEQWYASWGGAMEHVSTNRGVFGPEAWPGAEPSWGATADSLPLVGGLVTLEDLAAGEINHALAMAIPHARAGVYASPAQRSDGNSSSPFSLPEGSHLRLDPRLNLAALHLPKLTLMLAEAAQRYGILIRDQAAIVTFYAQEPLPSEPNPYRGPGGYLQGRYPSELLASFPWTHLELLEAPLHTRGES